VRRHSILARCLDGKDGEAPKGMTSKAVVRRSILDKAWSAEGVANRFATVLVIRCAAISILRSDISFVAPSGCVMKA